MRRFVSLRRGLAAATAVLLGLAPARASAQGAPPAPHEDVAFDVMNVLARQGWHDLRNEAWNVYGQFTYISSWKRPFSAAYTNAGGTPHSLSTEAERSFTGSFTLYLGVRLWPGGEAYFVPEVVALRALSDLKGLGGAIQNFELQKGGSETPQIYRSRAFLRQTIELGGAKVDKASDPLQLGASTTARRLVFTLGNFTILDVFARNGVTGDPRQTFLNMAFMTHAAWDFGSDARGYAYGATAELLWDDWAARLGRVTPPAEPNALSVDFHVLDTYGDQLELEHRHRLRGREGAVRLLGYRNRVRAGRFADAVAAFRSDPSKNAASCTGFSYDSPNGAAPDLCWVRAPTAKWGVGLELEQFVAEDVGLFLRAMWSDGASEVFAYTSADRSASLGAVAKGTLWRRDLDVAGAGVALGWISADHAEYLRLGGVDGFIGDGSIDQGVETVWEVFYSVNLLRAIWLTADLQRIVNPAMNRARGPVDVLGARIHAEF